MQRTCTAGTGDLETMPVLKDKPGRPIPSRFRECGGDAESRQNECQDIVDSREYVLQWFVVCCDNYLLSKQELVKLGCAKYNGQSFLPYLGIFLLC